MSLRHPLQARLRAPGGGRALRPVVAAVLLLLPLHLTSSAEAALVSPPVVAMAATPSGGGFWLTAADGTVTARGDATFVGSMAGHALSRPVSAIAGTPTGKGYWLAATDGQVLAFGDAPALGSVRYAGWNGPITGMAATSTGKGYRVVAKNGKVWAFGDATLHGSLAGTRISAGIVALVQTASGKGYWLVGADGKVYRFGDARSSGSATPGTSTSFVGMAPTATGNGYWLVTASGAVVRRGDAPTNGPLRLGGPVVAVAPAAGGLFATSAAPELTAIGATPRATLQRLGPSAAPTAPTTTAPPATTTTTAPPATTTTTVAPPPTTTTTTTAPQAPVTGTVVSTADQLTAAISVAKPGETILMRGGTYRGRWYAVNNGNLYQPITLRSYPGEWAVLDGNGPSSRNLNAVVYVAGKYWNLEHFEVTDTTPLRSARIYGVNVYGYASNTRHLVVHDTKTALGMWTSNGGSETYGNLFYNNGNSNLDHSIYTTNTTSYGAKRLEQNILLNTSGYNLHAYHNRDQVSAYRVTGNIATGAGTVRPDPQSRGNLLFAVEPGNTNRVRDITVERNYTYSPPGRHEMVEFDYARLTGHDGLAMRDNVWLLPRAISTYGWTNVTSSNDTIALRSAGQGLNTVRVERSDRYEAGRGNIVVFNSAKAPSVKADVSSVLQPGQRYTVWNAFDIKAGPLQSGTYDGSPLTLSMDPTKLQAATPHGLARPAATAPEFGVFIVRATTGWVSPR